MYSDENDVNENGLATESSNEENDLNIKNEFLTETRETINTGQLIVFNEENDVNENDIFIEAETDTEKTQTRGSNLFLHHFTRVAANQFLKTYDHHVISNINRNSSIDIECIANENLSLPENLFKFFTPFPLKSTCPIPVIDPWSSSRNVICGKDPANELTRQKKEMNRQLLQACRVDKMRKITSGKKVAADMRKKLDKIKLHKKYAKSHKVPHIIFRLASIYENDPDRNFHSNYNWYYTGGCVATAAVQNRNILFSARGQDCDTLYCVPLKRSSVASAGFRAKDAHSKYQKCDSSGPIYQVVAQEHPDTAIVGVRQQKNIMIYNCDRNPSESLQLLLRSSDVFPFTSLALSPWSALEMCTLNQAQELEIWDLQTSRSKLLNYWYNEECKMQWCGVHYSYQSPNILYLSTDRAVYSVDTKDGYSGHSSTMLVLEHLHHILEPCEIITAAASSTVCSNIQYIATSHHLFSMDIRKPGQAVQCWTHLMHGPPQYIGLSCDIPDREIICLGNTGRSEVITLVNEWLDGVPYSRTQPYALNSIGETLTEAKLRGLCLNPTVQSRLKLALTGICCTSSSSPAVFTSTAAGDVFCQRITSRFANQDEEEENLSFEACLTYWQEKVMEVENTSHRKPLFFNECKTASRLLKRSFCHESTEPSKSIESQPVRPTWILPTDLLFNSKDEAQAARILNAWGVTDQKSWDRLQSVALAGLPSSTVQPGQLVEKWLTENPLSQHGPDTQDTQMSQLYDSQMSQPYGSQMSTIEHFSASQQPLIPSTSNWQKPPSDAGSDVLLQTQMHARRKSGVPKIKKRTDGF